MKQAILPLPFQINSYVLTDKIGEGEFSIVYKATKGNDLVAVKVIPFSILCLHYDITILQKEIDVLFHLSHENVVFLYDCFSDDKHVFVVMEHCPGGDLEAAILKGKFKKEHQIASIFYQIVSGVSYIHSRGVVHRDLKSSNILLGLDDKIKICDFGLCDFMKEYHTDCVGSPCYASPEVNSGIKYDGKRNDIWSLGVILYELLTQRIPWGDLSDMNTVHQKIRNAQFAIPADVPSGAAQLVRSLMRLHPEERPTMGEILGNLWLKKGKYQPESALVRRQSVPHQATSATQRSRLRQHVTHEKNEGPIAHSSVFGSELTTHPHLDFIDQSQIERKPHLKVNGLHLPDFSIRDPQAEGPLGLTKGVSKSDVTLVSPITQGKKGHPLPLRRDVSYDYLNKHTK